MDCPGGCCKNGKCYRNRTSSKTRNANNHLSPGDNTSTLGVVCKNGMCHRVPQNQFWEKDSTQQDKENDKWTGFPYPNYSYWETSNTDHKNSEEGSRSAWNKFWEFQFPEYFRGKGTKAYGMQYNPNRTICMKSQKQYWEMDKSQPINGMRQQKWEMDSDTDDDDDKATQKFYGIMLQYHKKGNHTSVPQKQHWEYEGVDSSDASYYDDTATCLKRYNNNSSKMAEALTWKENYDNNRKT